MKTFRLTHQQISSIPQPHSPLPTAPVTRKNYSPAKKKSVKHHPHQSNRNRIVPHRLPQKGSTQLHAAYCTKVSPFPPVRERAHNLRNGSPIGSYPYPPREAEQSCVSDANCRRLRARPSRAVLLLLTLCSLPKRGGRCVCVCVWDSEDYSEFLICVVGDRLAG